ncbi:MAG: hypothetical protein E5Y73_11055 [Mesorhizobium sp.]|uniref:hypothetical protein n=1 Tax=Mesorhizobium sp. TaxID=1871066 RepID=UPI00122B75B8|nr:hypothetical protein [Mesorhizobium sp.]TIL94641.1 MAG: hypothetical protein E5Y73_11055 [Mesorhizobium sp.]
MVLTPAEKQKRYRERQKAAELAAAKATPTKPGYLKRPFSEFVGDRHFSFDASFDAYGVHISGPNFLRTEIQTFKSEYHRDEPVTALERAVGILGACLDAADELSVLINQYKLEGVGKAIEEALQASANLPRGDVEALKASFAEIDRLKAIQTQLRAPTRFVFPSIQVKAERLD